MIHFFPTFSATADDTPFGQELRRQAVPYRMFAGSVRLRFRSRVMLLLLGYPRLAAFALRSAFRSLFRSRPRPDAVVVGSDVEVLVFALVRLFAPARPRIVLQGFIYTVRASSLQNSLRLAYYRFVLARCGGVICHSRLELERYRRLFPRSAGSFACVPWGGDFVGSAGASPPSTEPGRPLRVLAAGRSGRDYATLVRAAAGTDAAVTIVCDSAEALAGVAGVRVLRHCYDADYRGELLDADAVVVPLAVEDISAGQMVMIQAMAFRRPLVVTRTPTIEEYLRDGVEALLVERGDAAGLRLALDRLRQDGALRARLAAAAYDAYQARFTLAAFVRGSVAAIQRGLPP